MHDPDFDPRTLPPSRSQRRRDALDVLELAERLVALTASQMREVPLDEAVLDAVRAAQKISAHIAHKRQVHYLAKLLRKVDDLEPIRLAVDKPLEVRRQETATLHLIERWRERLVEGGDEVLAELIEQYPHANRQRLRQLARQALVERRENRAPSAFRNLFQELKLLLRAPTTEGAHGEDALESDADDWSETEEQQP